ncbi:MAG: phage tail protein [Gammaproteobacteria bacterium]|nr:phage tail protein [Gammaproteobacteria bacterium]
MTGSNATYVGMIVLEVDGKEIEIKSMNPTTETGRQAVKTMNSSGRSQGYKDGIETHEISITAPVRVDEQRFSWESVTKAKLTIYPLHQDDKRVSYIDCFSTSVGRQYDVESEAVVDVSLTSLRKIEE